MSSPCLPPADVHLWWASLNVPERDYGAFLDMLSPDEHGRAERYVRALDRRRFVVARALLRTILARYLGRRPQEIRFHYAPQGKPRLSGLDSELPLEFNLAHSHELALYAISRQRRVGVDIEWMRPMADLEQVVASAFSRAEQVKMSALAANQRVQGFFNGWTRKEAYLKARGDGLLLPLDAFDVSFAPGEPAALLANRLDPNEVGRWSLHAVATAPGYAGALAVQGRGAQPCVRQWDIAGLTAVESEDERHGQPDQ